MSTDETPEQFSVTPESLEQGVFNFVISLVQKRAETMGMKPAREHVASYLEQIASGLRDMEENDVGTT